jgi:hypothetical protein
MQITLLLTLTLHLLTGAFWVDSTFTLARAAAHSLIASLEDVAAFFGHVQFVVWLVLWCPAPSSVNESEANEAFGCGPSFLVQSGVTECPAAWLSTLQDVPEKRCRHP